MWSEPHAREELPQQPVVRLVELRSLTEQQMGCFQMSKALSPHHYGETVANPVKTRLLLKAWMIFRARMNGWADARPGRQRHVASMMASLRDGVRAADTRERPRFPLLEHPAAHKWLQEWVPDLVLELLESS